jgi:hypothetical protein
MPIELERAYIAPINITAAFTAQIDIFECLSAANKPGMLLGWEFGQTSEVGDTQEEWLELVLKYVTGAPTSGTGGGTSTFRPRSPNQTAAGLTLETGNTTKLTGGTSVEIGRFAWNVRQTCLYVPVIEERFIFDQATRIVLELVTTPADSISAVKGRLICGEVI